MSLVVGVDLATATARAVAVDLSGGVLAENAVSLPAVRRGPGGRVEQDADYATTAKIAIGATVSTLGTRAADVVAISITGTSGTVVPCDMTGAPIGRALMYDDARASATIDRIAALTEHLPQHRLLTTASSALARVAWLQQHSPAALYLSTPDVVLAALAGRVLATDTSHSLKSGADLASVEWPADVFSALGVSLDALPLLVPPGTVVGEVCTRVAERLGLPKGVKLVAGMTDGCAAQIAAGAVNPGTTVGVLGTTLVLKGVAQELVEGFEGAVYSHRSPTGHYWPGGASNVGAGALNHYFAGADLSAFDKAAAAWGPSSMLWYPLLAEGERFPFAAPHARGFSLREGVEPIDRYRALLEGVALVERLGIDRLAATGVVSDEHHVVGGGSRSETWLRIRATALQRPLHRPAEASSGFGAAVLAASVPHGGLPAATRAMVHDDLTVDPEPSESQALDERYTELTDELAARGWLVPDTTHR